MLDDIAGYAHALRELSAASLIKTPLDAAIEDLAKDSLFKSMFYRIDDEKNVYTGIGTKNRESELEEYLCALNTKDVLEYMHHNDFNNAGIKEIL